MEHENILAFDIGGTWIRSAIISKGYEARDFKLTPSFNYTSYPRETVEGLQQLLLNYIRDVFNDSRKKGGINRITISMGAAMRGDTGVVLGSGPLWGSECSEFNLKQKILEIIPNIPCDIINDVSASLNYYVKHKGLGDDQGKTCLVSIGTGIACRIYDSSTNSIPLDKISGLQGEIGHYPISYQLDNSLINKRCDCGGLNHLSAFISGRGIKNIIPDIKRVYCKEYHGSLLCEGGDGKNDAISIGAICAALEKGDIFSGIILENITRPLAEIIILMLTLDPNISRIVLTGGVVDSFGGYYISYLIENMKKIKMYMMDSYSDTYFDDMICLLEANSHTNLIGSTY